MHRQKLIDACLSYEGETKQLLIWFIVFPSEIGQVKLLVIFDGQTLKAEVVKDLTTGTLRAAHLYNVFTHKYGG